jgi:hypothetical protein
MEKRKMIVSPHMRERLMVNRNGKLTGEQWKDMVTEPLVTLLLLLAPAIVVLGPRLVLTARFLCIGALIVAVVLGVVTLLRAQRYARTQVRFAELDGGETTAPFWQFWKPLRLYNQNGEPMVFPKRLAPYVVLQPDQTYLVYYLQDATELVLLSIAPADHPDAKLWQPTEAFQRRFQKRSTA